MWKARFWTAEKEATGGVEMPKHVGELEEALEGDISSGRGAGGRRRHGEHTSRSVRRRERGSLKKAEVENGQVVQLYVAMG